MIRIYDIETDKLIDREMTDAEYSEYKADQIVIAADEQTKAHAVAAKDAALAKLAALGLTTDDLKALGL